MDHDQLTAPKIAPTSATKRFGPIDALRGFALLGILVPNIVAFAWPMQAMSDPLVISDAPANAVAHTITSIVFLMKFMFLFALLFGSGVIMYARKFDKADDEGNYHTKIFHGASLWYLRCGILLCFGLMHAYLLWYGDILVLYALAGLTLLWWVRRLNPKLQFWGGLALFYMGSAFSAGLTCWAYWALTEGHMSMEEMFGDPTREIVGYTGSFFDAFKTRFFTTLMIQIFMGVLMMPAIWGIMTMGMGLTRMRILTGEKSLGFYVKAAIICLGVGVPVTVFGYLYVHHTFDLAPGFLWQAFAQPVGVPMAFGLGALVIALAKWAPARIITVPLAAVGRMALTNYFLHTILCTTFFYGYGFGKYASIEYPQLWLVVFTVWGINIVFSMLWLRVFTMGPFEWAWRVLTYRQLVPIVRHSARSDA